MAGIDLGTSNSAIAHIHNGKPEVIKPDRLSDVIPSVVFIDQSGAVEVGESARKCMLTLGESEGTGHSRWKPRMGQDDRYHFSAAKQTKTGPELSGLVIRHLLNSYARRTSEELTSCVITIPAKFDQPANEATREAARLAGLEHASTLKEPIAAALAYGFSNTDNRANWMVFDLGGGTLDVCLMVVREGELSVLQGGQAGDQHLGGTNFDRTLLDFVLGPSPDDRLKMDRFQKLQSDYAPLRKRYKLNNFSEKSHRLAWNQLLLAVEEAKIELSRKPEVEIYLDAPICKDEAGRDVEVRVPITRTAYERLISSDIERAVNICLTLLSKNRMSADDLDQLILVGGPTKTPYLHEVLSNRLDIELDVRVDPMTAVALGAALHAETEEFPGRRARPVQTKTDINVRLDYQRSSQQPTCTVAGVLEGKGLTPGMSVEFARDDGNWTSGKTMADDTGFFTADLLLIEKGSPHQSIYTTRVYDAQGSQIATVDEPRIWHPLPTAKGTLTNSIGIAITGNQTIPLLEQGQALPAKAKAHVLTATALRRGSSDDMLRIPVIEAVTSILGAEDRDHADAHMKIGELNVSGDHERLTMDLPKGSEIELAINIDSSQTITMTAYVELLEDEFEVQLVTNRREQPSLEELEARFMREKGRFKEVKTLYSKHPSESTREAIEAIEREQAIETIEAALQRVREGEETELTRAFKRILELAGTINQCWEEQTYSRLVHRVGQIRSTAEGEQLDNAKTLEKAVADVGSNASRAELKKLEAEVDDLDIKVRFAPFYKLISYLLALSGLRVSQVQHDAHKQADNLAGRLIDKGAPESLTANDLSEIERMNKKIEDVYPDLYEHLARYRRDNPHQGSMMDSYGSTVTRSH